MNKRNAKQKASSSATVVDYSGLLGGIGELLEAACRASASTINASKPTERFACE